METLKRIFYIVSGLFSVFALLIIFQVLSREFFVLNFGLVNMEEIYRMLLLVAVLLLLIVMLLQALSTASMRTDLQRAQLKVNELKADLYDKRQQVAQRQRNAQLPDPHAGFPAQPAPPAAAPGKGQPDQPVPPLP